MYPIDQHGKMHTNYIFSRNMFITDELTKCPRKTPTMLRKAVLVTVQPENR
jgi:hypothetical protein